MLKFMIPDVAGKTNLLPERDSPIPLALVEKVTFPVVGPATEILNMDMLLLGTVTV